MFPDGRLHLVGCREVGLFERLVVLDEQVDVVGVDERVAERARHVLVDDGDHGAGAFDGRQRRIDRRTQRHVAVRVRRRHLNHRHVAGQRTAPVELLRLAQEDGDVIGVTGLRHFPHVAAHEERIELENALEFGRRIGRGAFGVQVVDMHVAEFLVASSFAHGVDEALGCAGDAAQMDVVAAFNHLHRFGGGDEPDLFGHICK